MQEITNEKPNENIYHTLFSVLIEHADKTFQIILF